MAEQKTIQISGAWQSLNVLSGAAVGAEIKAQIIQGRDVRVATSDAIPTDDVHGYRFSAGEFFQSQSGAKETWVRASVDGDLGLLEVEF